MQSWVDAIVASTMRGRGSAVNKNPSRARLDLGFGNAKTATLCRHDMAPVSRDSMKMDKYVSSRGWLCGGWGDGPKEGLSGVRGWCGSWGYWR